ncbi:MAG: hypothetical protein M3Z10_07745 [Gemmatimonadota bacterium]|nr:hypothetical protein [Gemmatimonadota bacterium]
MSGAVGLDLRIPIGGLFAALGILLTAYGVATRGSVDIYARSAGLNINLWWGAVLFVIGLLFLFAARRAARLPVVRPATELPRGPAI